jgi:hypothetical protein
MIAAAPRAIEFQQTRRQRIQDMASLLSPLDQASVMEHGEMVRHVDELDLQTVAQFRDVARPILETANDAQPRRVGKSAEKFSTAFRL